MDASKGDVRLQFVGADGILLTFGDTISAEINTQVQAATAALERSLGEELVDMVPSYTTLLVLYDPLQLGHMEMAARTRLALRGCRAGEARSGAQVVLPVYYSVEAGRDLQTLAADAGLSVQEVIDLHSGRDYRVYAIGFAPGFAYLGEVDPRIARPRHPTPRASVPAGSVAIADGQTAVYPAASPGGWNLIGRCPRIMFDPEGNPPMPVAVGDRVQFAPISRGEYLDLGGSLD